MYLVAQSGLNLAGIEDFLCFESQFVCTLLATLPSPKAKLVGQGNQTRLKIFYALVLS
jgi:hypothetical protein